MKKGPSKFSCLTKNPPTILMKGLDQNNGDFFHYTIERESQKKIEWNRMTQGSFWVVLTWNNRLRYLTIISCGAEHYMEQISCSARAFELHNSCRQWVLVLSPTLIFIVCLLITYSNQIAKLMKGAIHFWNCLLIMKFFAKMLNRWRENMHPCHKTLVVGKVAVHFGPVKRLHQSLI